MSRPPKVTLPDRQKLQRQELNQTAPLREIYPQLAEVRVELDFDDGTEHPPSDQAFSYFPGARSLFRYPCPCRGCNGEFGLTEYIAEVAGGTEQAVGRRVTVACPGQRVQAHQERAACPIRVNVHISATLRTPE